MGVRDPARGVQEYDPPPPPPPPSQLESCRTSAGRLATTIWSFCKRCFCLSVALEPTRAAHTRTCGSTRRLRLRTGAREGARRRHRNLQQQERQLHAACSHEAICDSRGHLTESLLAAASFEQRGTAPSVHEWQDESAASSTRGAVLHAAMQHAAQRPMLHGRPAVLRGHCAVARSVGGGAGQSMRCKRSSPGRTSRSTTSTLPSRYPGEHLRRGLGPPQPHLRRDSARANKQRHQQRRCGDQDLTGLGMDTWLTNLQHVRCKLHHRNVQRATFHLTAIIGGSTDTAT